MTFVLDASAYLRFVDDEAGSDRIVAIIQHRVEARDRILISAVHWGEVVGVIFKRSGQQGADDADVRVRALGIEIIAVTGPDAGESAKIKARYKVPYVDSFAVELASRFSNHLLLTGDFDFKPVTDLVRVEFLPTKPPQVPARS